MLAFQESVIFTAQGLGGQGLEGLVDRCPLSAAESAMPQKVTDMVLGV